MRKLTDHIVNPVNDKLTITVTDEPGAGGANHAYLIECDEGSADVRTKITFQKGAINEAGINGITQEVLLAIVADRLRSFQAGPFACPENAIALQRTEQAMDVLKARTVARMQRGVEGRTVV